MSIYDYLGKPVTSDPSDYADWTDEYCDDEEEYDEDAKEESSEDIDDGSEDNYSGCYETSLISVPYADLFDVSEEEEGEAQHWNIEIKLSFSVDRENCICDISHSGRVFGGEGLGDVDPDECWNDEIEQEAISFFQQLTE